LKDRLKFSRSFGLYKWFFVALRSLILCLSVLFILLSCSTSNNVPEIVFKGLEYYRVGEDSMILSFDLHDADRDFGLKIDEQYPPFHPYNMIIDSRDEFVTYGDDQVKPPLYVVDPSEGGNKTLFSETDNRPLYNCQDYYLPYGSKSDAFYIQKNPYYNNLHIAFQRKVNGQYEKVDFAAEYADINCSSVNFDCRLPSPAGASTEIHHKMTSFGFPAALRQDTFRIKFFVYDRALHKSNEVVTPDFTLKSIQQ